MPNKQRTVFSYLGVKLDALGKDLPADERRARWRPTAALCHHLQPDTLVLLHEPRFDALAEIVTLDAVAACSQPLRVEHLRVKLRDAWNFADVYDALHAAVTQRTYDTDTHDYAVHLTTGNNRVQTVLYQLAMSRHLPARLVHTIAPNDPTLPPGKTYTHPWGGFRADPDDPDHPLRNASIRSFQPLEQLTGPDLSARRDRTAPALGRGFIATRDEVLKVAARTRDPMLLMGPTGIGKTTLAREIREARRPKGPFVAVNCATLTGDIVLSALFGHEKGSFTGASEPHLGYLQQAHGGLLFLDEIGELPLVAQAQLLKAIEEKQFRRVGGTREVKSDFDLVAAANADLHERVAEGRFRRDLLARIDLWTFRLPSLRETDADFLGLLIHQLGEIARPRDGTGAVPPLQMARLTTEASTRFRAFATSDTATWDGNFRDVLAAARRMTLRAGDRALITLEIVEQEIRELRARWEKQSRPDGGDRVTKYLGPSRAAEIDRFSRVQLEEVLRACETAHTLAEASRQLFGPRRANSGGEAETLAKPRTARPQNESDRLSKYLSRHHVHWPLTPHADKAGGDA